MSLFPRIHSGNVLQEPQLQRKTDDEKSAHIPSGFGRHTISLGINWSQFTVGLSSWNFSIEHPYTLDIS